VQPKDLAEPCRNRSFELSIPAGAPRAAYDRAVALARIGVELPPSPAADYQALAWRALALAQYRRVVLCCLRPSASVAIEELDRIAEGAIALLVQVAVQGGFPVVPRPEVVELPPEFSYTITYLGCLRSMHPRARSGAFEVHPKPP